LSESGGYEIRTREGVNPNRFPTGQSGVQRCPYPSAARCFTLSADRYEPLRTPTTETRTETKPQSPVGARCVRFRAAQANGPSPSLPARRGPVLTVTEATAPGMAMTAIMAIMNGPLTRPARTGPPGAYDTTNEEWGLLVGHHRGLTHGHQWGLFHGHGQAAGVWHEAVLPASWAWPVGAASRRRSVADDSSIQRRHSDPASGGTGIALLVGVAILADPERGEPGSIRAS